MTFSESRPAVCHPAADAAFPEEEAGAHACWGPRRPPRRAEPRCPGSRREPPRTYKQSSLYRQIGEVRASQASRPRESSLSSRAFTGPARRPDPAGFAGAGLPSHQARVPRDVLTPCSQIHFRPDSAVVTSCSLARRKQVRTGREQALRPRRRIPVPRPGLQELGGTAVSPASPPPPQLGLLQLHPFSGSGGSVKGRRWPEPLTADPGAPACWTDSRSLSCRLASLCFLFIHLFHGFGLLPGSSGRSQAQDFGL